MQLRLSEQSAVSSQCRDARAAGVYDCPVTTGVATTVQYNLINTVDFIPSEQKEEMHSSAERAPCAHRSVASLLHTEVYSGHVKS